MFLKKALLLSCLMVFATGFVSTSANKIVEAKKAPTHCDFFPPNHLMIPVIAGSKQMSEQDFNNILDLVQKVYTPLFVNYGFGLFQIERRWTDNTVNAFADVGSAKDSSGKTVPARFIHMFGGLARHPEMTREGFLLVACHEIGHHLGGYPRFSEDTWASVEGEADYYSTSKCARFVLGQLSTNVAWATHTAVDPLVTAQCTSSFTNQNQQALCMRSSIAGLALGRTLGSLEGNVNVLFGTPDKSVVTETNPDHPAAQCRLDTYFQASLCQKPETDRMGAGPGQGACEAPERGARPACWYHTTAASARVVSRR